MPCNILHTLLPKIKDNTNLEVLDLIEVVSSYIQKRFRKVGILSTNKTRNDRLYEHKLKGVKIIYPTLLEQKKISKIIIRIIRNTFTKKDQNFLYDIIDKMNKKGVEKVILACTDLANIIKKNSNTIDSTEILIKLILNKMRQK